MAIDATVRPDSTVDEWLGRRALLLAAPDPAALTAMLDRKRPAGATTTGARLGIVAPTPRKLALARQVVDRGRAWRGRDDVWFSPNPLITGGGRIAFLFPGLEADFAPRVDDVAVLLGAEVPDLTISGVGRHTAAVLGVGRLLDRAVRALGVAPDAVAGHSVGEWGAMIAGGLVAAADFDAMIAAADLDALRVPGVEFAVLGCPARRVADLLATRRETVISHENSTNQTVVCGPADELNGLVDELRRAGVICRSMPFRSGFHTPMLAPYLDVFAAGVPSLPMRPATVPVWSATTASPFPTDSAAARELCVRHLVEPVRFRELVLRLHDSGVRVFVHMGPGQLGSMVADTLRGAEYLSVAANSAHRPGIDTLRRLATAIWVEGGAPDFTALDLPTAPRFGATFPAAAEFGELLAETGRAVAAVLAAADSTMDTLEVSTAAMPYLLDHCLAEQRADWPDEADRRPVVPGTTMVAHLMAAAPRGTVVEVADIRFHQWLEASPPRRIDVSCRPLGAGRHTVRLGEHADAVVLADTCYPPEPAPWPRQPDERVSAMTARQLYDERWLFHGPAFQGVTRSVAISQRGIRGEITVPDVPGGLLDNVGHLLGQWLIEHHGDRFIAFPVRIDRIRWYGPEPPTGAIVDCELRFTGNDVAADGFVVADALLSVRGRPVVSIEGWRDVLFDAGGQVQSVHRGVASNTLSTRDGQVWRLPLDLLSGTAVRDLCLRKYLGTAERTTLEGGPLATRNRRLCELIAIKDAVRGRLWDGGAGPIFPAELHVDTGTYLVTGRHGRTVPELVIDLAVEDGTVVVSVFPKDHNQEVRQ